MEEPKVGCGVFGAITFVSQSVFPYIYWGLRAQNHRGHQSHGFLTYNQGGFFSHKNLDLVPKVKSRAIQEWFGRLPGQVGLGNIRYTTSGRCDEKSLLQGTQPVTAAKNGIKLAISYNGNIVNTAQLQRDLCKYFPDFVYDCDSDVVCHKLLIELEKNQELSAAVEACMLGLDGAFSVIGITGNGDFFAFKDPHGIRPLCAGHSPDGKTFVFASETVSLDINGFIRDFELKPGELVRVNEDGFERKQVVRGDREAFCAFKFAYFSRPDSRFN
ncbi:hypothetical protein KAI12_02725, partial [Candidatus Bathyarchaeota archaeon]|nr:hypothetical protein [Candidatus Bathyarchaeota archaeon]